MYLSSTRVSSETDLLGIFFKFHSSWDTHPVMLLCALWLGVSHHLWSPRGSAGEGFLLSWLLTGSGGKRPSVPWFAGGSSGPPQLGSRLPQSEQGEAGRASHRISQSDLRNNNPSLLLFSTCLKKSLGPVPTEEEGVSPQRRDQWEEI